MNPDKLMYVKPAKKTYASLQQLIEERKDFLVVRIVPCDDGWDVMLRLDGTYYGAAEEYFGEKEQHAAYWANEFDCPVYVDEAPSKKRRTTR